MLLLGEGGINKLQVSLRQISHTITEGKSQEQDYWEVE